MYYKLLEKEYPFKMKKNKRKKWVYSQKDIRIPVKLDNGQKEILKKMLKIEPKERSSIDEIIYSLALKLESKKHFN